MLSLSDPASDFAIAAIFLLAGVTKGVIGLGLPTISLGLLTMLFDLPNAMALLLIPSFVTNVWQASVGGQAQSILKRLWPFLFVAFAGIWIGSRALLHVDHGLLSAVLGGLLIVYASVSLVGFRSTLSTQYEIRTGVVCGAVNGVLTGMTGSFVVPGVMYLQALGLPRDMLMQAMGMLFAISTVGLAFALHRYSYLTAEIGMTSAFAVVPAILGMVIGQWIRDRLSEDIFRRVFFMALLILGANIIIRTV